MHASLGIVGHILYGMFLFIYAVHGLIHQIPYFDTLQVIESAMFQPFLPRIQQAGFMRAATAQRSNSPLNSHATVTLGNNFCAKSNNINICMFCKCGKTCISSFPHTL